MSKSLKVKEAYVCALKVRIAPPPPHYDTSDVYILYPLQNLQNMNY